MFSWRSALQLLQTLDPQTHGPAIASCHSPWYQSSVFYDPMNVGNLISGSFAFTKSSLYISKFLAHLLLKPSLKTFEHYLASMWNQYSCTVVWTFFCIALVWDWNENWSFLVLWICRWHYSNGRKQRGTKKLHDDSERGEWKSWFKTSIQKTKIMANNPNTPWQIHREKVETLTDFIFLSSKITADGNCSHEIKRCLLLGRKLS